MGVEERIVGRVRTRWETKYFPALQAYLKIHGNMLVPRKYVVPESSAEWPRAAWGVRLGNVVHNLRRVFTNALTIATKLSSTKWALYGKQESDAQEKSEQNPLK